MTPQQAEMLDAANDDFQAFLDLACVGVSASASDAEHAAYRLAWAAIDSALFMPDSAMPGYCQFVAIASKNRDVARMLLS